MATPAPAAIRGELVRVAQVGLDRHEFARDAVRVLRRAVAFDAVAVVWFDPATGLPVDKWIDNSLTGSAGSRLAESELEGRGQQVQTACRLGPAGCQDEQCDRRRALGYGPDARTAVTLAPARAPELTELVADVHGLTARERRVAELVAHGLPTAAIAARLYLSTYTIQDHLKAIFEKLDVSNRGQLVAKLYLDHSLGRGQHPPP